MEPMAPSATRTASTMRCSKSAMFMSQNCQAEARPHIAPSLLTARAHPVGGLALKAEVYVGAAPPHKGLAGPVDRRAWNMMPPHPTPPTFCTTFHSERL